MKTNNVFLKHGKGVFIGASEHEKVLPENMTKCLYNVSIEKSMFGMTIILKEVEIKEKIIRFKNSYLESTLKKIVNFFSSEIDTKYKELGISQKVAYCFYGPIGTGKTVTVQTLALDIIKVVDNSIAINIPNYFQPHEINAVIESIRGVKGDYRIIIIIDEIENSFSSYQDQWLPFLDGVTSPDNIVLLGTTNYPKEIPIRIRNRKSRIKEMIELSSLPPEVFYEYCLAKCPKLNVKTIEECVYLAVENQFSIDLFKNLIIDVYINNMKPEESLKNYQNELKGVDNFKEEYDDNDD